MNDQWGPTGTGRTSYFEAPPTSLPSTVRTSIQDAIRPGTVASRVQFLQNLAPPAPRGSHPSPISIPRGEETRTSFGRRLNKRFGPPALRGINPDDEPRIRSSYHAFLGLDTPRITHNEYHAIAQCRTKHARSPGINGQIAPEVVKVRHQHDALAPWGVLSRSKRTRSMGRHVADSVTDVLKENNVSRNCGRVRAASSRSSNDKNRKYLDLYRRTVESRAEDIIHSDTSIATSSTTRRRSVRDLFKDYGIERPPGLASPEMSCDIGDTPQTKAYRQCHVCSRLNVEISTACARCNHRLCFQCDAWSRLQEAHHNEGHPDQIGNISGGKPDSREKRLKDWNHHHHVKEEGKHVEEWKHHQHVKEGNVRPAPVPVQPQKEVPLSKQPDPNPAAKTANGLFVQPPKEAPVSKQAVSKPAKETSNGRRVESSTSQVSSTLKQDKLLPQAGPILSGIQVPTCVRDSPFLIADALALRRSRPASSNKAPAEKKNTQGQGSAQKHPLKRPDNRPKASSSPESCKCNSPSCGATHPGNRPFRHAASCTKKQRHRHVNKDIDQGYSADTSRIEDADHEYSRTYSHTSVKQIHQHFHPANPALSPRMLAKDVPRHSHPAKSTPSPRTSAKHLHQHFHPAKSTPSPCISCSPVMDPKLSQNRETLEFVKCHGYPRTGHERLGSPVSSGVVGECQHCLHDCHCEACKRTHHSVRCCTHEDHRSIAHKHLTPRKEMSAAEKETSQSVQPHISVKSTASKSVVEVPSNYSHQYRTAPTDPPRISASQLKEVASTVLVKRPGLARTKTSTLMASNVDKPPTPPPWVYSPRKQTNSGGVMTERLKETQRKDMDTAFDDQSLDYPFHQVSSSSKQSKSAGNITERSKETRPEDTGTEFDDQGFYDQSFNHSFHQAPSSPKESRSCVNMTEGWQDTRREDDLTLDDQLLNDSRTWVSNSPKQGRSSITKTERWQDTRREDDLAFDDRPLYDSPTRESRSPKQSKPGVPTSQSQEEAKLENNHTAFDFESVEEPSQLFKEQYTLAQPARHEDRRPQLSRRQSNDTWATLQSQNERLVNDDQRPRYRPISRGPIVEKHSRPPSPRPASTRPPSRMQVSPPGSRRASRRLSALFQLRGKNSIPILNQKLLEHQEELRRTQKDHKDQLQPNAKTSQEDLTQQKARREPTSAASPVPDEMQRAESANRKTSSTGKKKWRLRLVERRPSPACVNDEPVSGQHTLAEDELITTKQSLAGHALHDDVFINSGKFVEERTLADDEVIKRGKALQQHLLHDDEMAFDGKKSYRDSRETQAGQPSSESEQHTCLWKRRLEQARKTGGSLSIQGVTVLLHLEEREDVIFETDEWTGGEPRM